MIICSCNVLSDHDIRAAVQADDSARRSAAEVYRCLGCSVECGRCARSVKTIIADALGPCARACVAGCPHGTAREDLGDASDSIAA